MGFAQAWGGTSITGPYTMTSSGSVGLGSSIVVFVSEQFNGNLVTGVTDNQSNTYVRIGSPYLPPGGNVYLHCFFCQTATGGVVLTQTIQHSAGTVWADYIGMEYNDLGTFGAKDQYDVVGLAAGSTAPSVTAANPTTNANDHLVGCTWWESGSSSFTPGAGYASRFTQRDTTIGTSLAVMDQTVAATSTYTANATIGGSTEWVQALLSLKIGGSTPPPPPQTIVVVMG